LSRTGGDLPPRWSVLGEIALQFINEIAEVAVQMRASSSPQGRNATPEDLLGMLELLLSPASYIHGVDVPIAAGSVC
jgi:NAD(P)-dependent dehydrogenase (short-subunit alcohol dehydrogenase family)